MKEELKEAIERIANYLKEYKQPVFDQPQNNEDNPTKQFVKRYMERFGIDEKERINIEGGGQYINAFLLGFAKQLRTEILQEVKNNLKEIK